MINLLNSIFLYINIFHISTFHWYWTLDLLHPKRVPYPLDHQVLGKSEQFVIIFCCLSVRWTYNPEVVSSNPTVGVLRLTKSYKIILYCSLCSFSTSKTIFSILKFSTFNPSTGIDPWISGTLSRCLTNGLHVYVDNETICTHILLLWTMSANENNNFRQGVFNTTRVLFE